MAAPRLTPLQVRKLADRSGLREPDGSWPLAGISIEGEPPRHTRVPTSFVERGIAEGWITGVGAEPVMRPAGPTQDVWASSHSGQPHVFIHYDELLIDTVDGPLRYRVTHQPDKYVENGSDTQKVTPEIYAEGRTRVDHFYDLSLVG